jgi:hypothetical protein
MLYVIGAGRLMCDVKPMKAKRVLCILYISVLVVSGLTGCTSVSSEKSCWTDPTIEPPDDMPLAQKIALSIWWPLQIVAYGWAGGNP